MRKIILLTVAFFVFFPASFLPAQEAGQRSANIPELLGASKAGQNKIMIYIPASSPSGGQINQYQWVNRGMAVLNSIAGHAMACPPFMSWESMPGSALTNEGSAVAIYTFINDDLATKENIDSIKNFMMDMAKRNLLSSVFFEYNETLYKIDVR